MFRTKALSLGKRGTAASLLIASLAVCAQATVIYSENFDGGSSGQSIKNAPFGFVTQAGFPGGDIKLAPAVHGWSGMSLVGTSAQGGDVNELVKFLPLPTTGIVKFSADMYTYMSNPIRTGAIIRMFHGLQGDPSWHSIELGSNQSGPDDWTYSTDPPSGVWNSPVVLRDQVVRASIYYNQETGENWGSLSDGVSTWTSPHFFSPGLPMDNIVVGIDRRYSNGGDIDNLVVEALPVPEPISLLVLSIGVAITGGKARRAKAPLGSHSGVALSAGTTLPK